MNKGFTFQTATSDDLEMCIETIIQAEKSRTEIFPYSRIFNLPEKYFRDIFREILIEDIEGQELALSAFTIARHNNRFAGACASWIESINGVPSNILKSCILQQYIPESDFKNALPVLQMLKPLNIEREPLTIQIESLYIAEEFRTIDLFLELVQETAMMTEKQHPEIEISKW